MRLAARACGVRLIKKYQIEKQVSIVGRIAGKKKDEFFRKAYMVAVPSRTETFSIVSLETLAYSLPLVCFDIKGLSWIPRSVSYKVIPFNTDKLALAMYEVLKDARLRRDSGKKAYNFAKNYDWDKIFDQYEDYVNNVTKIRGYGQFKPFVDKIISDKIKSVFISPHLDDAVLYAGNLMFSFR